MTTRDDGTARGRWIASLKTPPPAFVLTTRRTMREAAAAEQAWIRAFREAGADLVNAAKGGVYRLDRTAGYERRAGLVA